MLLPIKKLLDNPRDIPTLSRAATEYLQVQYNAGFFMQMGNVDNLKRLGYSESYIAGYLAGLQYASQTIDDMEAIRQEQTENPE
ncbi:protein of unknown function DUF2717 [Rahnella phage Sarma103]|nr:protein of unknown function DUF2717 [Rahnella phage Sarma103]